MGVVVHLVYSLNLALSLSMDCVVLHDCAVNAFAFCFMKAGDIGDCLCWLFSLSLFIGADFCVSWKCWSTRLSFGFHCGISPFVVVLFDLWGLQVMLQLLYLPLPPRNCPCNCMFCLRVQIVSRPHLFAHVWLQFEKTISSLLHANKTTTPLLLTLGDRVTLYLLSASPFLCLLQHPHLIYTGEMTITLFLYVCVNK